MGAYFSNLDFEIPLKIVYNSIIPTKHLVKERTNMEMLDILKDLAQELIAACGDADLLDFVCKLLTHEML